MTPGLIHLITTSNHPAQHFEMNEAWILSGQQACADEAAPPQNTTTYEEHYPDEETR